MAFSQAFELASIRGVVIVAIQRVSAGVRSLWEEFLQDRFGRSRVRSGVVQIANSSRRVRASLHFRETLCPG